MLHDPDGAYCCPKCGATAALLLPEPTTRQTYVALKCLECAHIARVPRAQLESAGGPLDSNRSLD
jgi:RNase P subunit RPR2